MPITKSEVDRNGFNLSHQLPYELRISDFESAMQDVYDFFFDVNSHLVSKGLQRLDDMLRPAIMSGVLSDMVTASLAKHSRHGPLRYTGTGWRSFARSGFIAYRQSCRAVDRKLGQERHRSGSHLEIVMVLFDATES